MTAQSHIDAIGAAQIDLEEKAKAAKEAARAALQAVREVTKAASRLHGLQDAAQIAYSKSTSDNVVLFSGGTDKPDQNDIPEG